MKTKILLILVAVLSIMSCKKDSEGISTKMSATIDGKEWASVVRVTDLETNTGWFVITGTSITGEVLIITIKGSTAGTYVLNLALSGGKTDCLGNYKASANTTAEDIFTSTAGEVVLTKVDKTAKTISGTFEFTLVRNLTETKSVTKGVFNNLSYIEKAQ